MKLIALNLEGKRNYDATLPFLETEQADIVTLSEAAEDLQDWLREAGYYTSYLPMIIRERDGERYSEGLIAATKQPHHTTQHYYYQPPHGTIVTYDETNKRDTTSHGILCTTVEDIPFVSTHFTWTPHGETPNEAQRTDLTTLLAHLSKLPPHVLCGDFNIPRHENPLYEELASRYTDTVPATYTSSLDASRHRCGNDPARAKLFERFMVDYCFTQPPYHAHDVRLAFGVSDHAAVVATISTTPAPHPHAVY